MSQFIYQSQLLSDKMSEDEDRISLPALATGYLAAQALLAPGIMQVGKRAQACFFRRCAFYQQVFH
jgi:hypothetical protein